MVTVRQLASGRFAVVQDGKVTHRTASRDLADEIVNDILDPDGWWEGPSCGICDALGHGAEHGLRPCPIEDDGRYDPEERYYEPRQAYVNVGVGYVGTGSYI